MASSINQRDREIMEKFMMNLRNEFIQDIPAGHLTSAYHTCFKGFKGRPLKFRGEPPTEIILETAFQIPHIPITPQDCPGNSLRIPRNSRYCTRCNVNDRNIYQPTYCDSWLVMHLHIPLDEHTFEPVSRRSIPGIKAITIYPSQAIYVPEDNKVQPRAEWRFHFDPRKDHYDQSPNRDYNKRGQVFFFNDDDDRDLWYPGKDRWYPGTNIPQFVEGKVFVNRDLLNDFGRWLINDGALSKLSLQKIWPHINDRKLHRDKFPTCDNFVEKFFNTNWNSDGTEAQRLLSHDNIPRNIYFTYVKQYYSQYGDDRKGYLEICGRQRNKSDKKEVSVKLLI
ncbi:hypothetical protein B0J13DRAFT_624525 [Dactylonectria estremocensis]|uniref:Uncharacterized protein n=1 Tax=Dactylonectria estremocensis TaxID=1079267 RepID=A0A9P9EL72_9HYPO|nr:hypothetical protein B0J13DRAFT_624525 [Dactylonectria estremocensis]